MITYRIKRFSSTSNKIILPGNKRPCDPLPEKFYDKPEFRGLQIIVRVEEGEKYKRGINTVSEISRKRIKNLRLSLKQGHIYDNGSFENEETHYISKYSKPNKYHRMTKDINDHDRLDYIIYPPSISEDIETGKKLLTIKVVLQNCIGHFNWKDEKSYSEEI